MDSAALLCPKKRDVCECAPAPLLTNCNEEDREHCGKCGASAAKQRQNNNFDFFSLALGESCPVTRHCMWGNEGDDGGAGSNAVSERNDNQE